MAITKNAGWLVGSLVFLVGASIWFATRWRHGEENRVAPTFVQDGAGPRVSSSHSLPATVGADSDWQRADTNSVAVSFAALYSRAESGDVLAQRELAGLYERCSFFSQSPSVFNDSLDSLAVARGSSPDAYDEIKRRYKATCSSVDGGQRIPNEAYALWYEQAAKSGDTLSRIRRAASNSGDLTAKDFQAIARDATNSADPDAIFALGNLLSLAPDSADLGEFSGLSKGPYMTLAWGIAACRLGADCRPGSARMDEMCITAGVCGPLDFEDGVRLDLVPQGQLGILEKNIRDIQSVLGSH